MKIVRAHEFGGPDKLVVDDVVAPEAGAGQLRITVKAAGVNPVDWKLLSGKTPIPTSLPLVPGGDIAGVVDSVGAGVGGWAIGDRVFAHPGLIGGYAGQVVLDASIAAPLPPGVSFSQAAAMPLAALTVWQAFAADARELAGLHVLVHNAAGGVGNAAVQIAKIRGARVTATASDINAEFVRGLGADEVVDFRTVPLDGRAADVDMLLDLVGNSLEIGMWALVRQGGSVLRVAGGVSAPPEEVADGIRAFKLLVRPDGDQLRSLAKLMMEGKLRAEIARHFPLDQAADALRLSMGGHVRGKILLDFA